MNLKSKIFGFAAASVLALTMTTGVMAQQTTTGETDASVTLGTGSCSMSINQGSVTFDPLIWDGSRWINLTEKSITANVKNGQPGQFCDIQARSEGLFGPGEEGTNVIGVSVNTVQMGEVDFKEVASSQTGEVYLDFALYGVGSHHAPGEYSGTIDFKVGSGE